MGVASFIEDWAKTELGIADAGVLARLRAVYEDWEETRQPRVIVDNNDEIGRPNAMLMLPLSMGRAARGLPIPNT